MIPPILTLVPKSVSAHKTQFDKECKSNRTVSAATTLRMEIYDSDRPADPDWIGMSKVRMSDLILLGMLDKKESFPIEGRQFPKYSIKAKIDFKPQK